MTLQQYVESISRLFPDKGQTEIITDVNAVMRDFSARTMLLPGLIDMEASTLVNNYALITLAYNGTTLTIPTNPSVPSSGYISFNIPDEVVAVKNIHTYLASEQEVYGRCAFEIIDNEIRVYNLADPTSVTLPTGVVTVKFECVLYAVPLAALGDVPDFDEEFHRAIEAKVCELYYRRVPIAPSAQPTYINTVAMAKSMLEEYERAVVKAKRMFYINHNIGTAASAASDF